MKLSELHPEFGTADGYQGRWFLIFDCPTTPGGRIYVLFHRAPQETGIWQCTSPFRVVPDLEHLGEQPDLSLLTLVPSIGDHFCKMTKGVGQRCQGHVNIHNGEIV